MGHAVILRGAAMSMFRSAEMVEDTFSSQVAREASRADQAEQMLELVQENLAQIELAFEDMGWAPLGTDGSQFSEQGRKNIRDRCRLYALANPLIKRGLALRHAYVWGGGVTISGSAPEDGEGQDVNAVLQAFLDRNAATFSGAQAREENQRALGTDGELMLALVTSDRLVGTVDVRVIPAEEIVDVITNPEDAAQPQLYLRRHVTRKLAQSGAYVQQTEHVAYPAVGYRRRGGWPASVEVDGTRYRVDRQTSVRAVTVNRPSNSLRGVPHAFAALPWARGYKEFLEQWATLMHALSQFALKQSTPPGKARLAAIDATRAVTSATNPSGVGANYTAPTGYNLEAVSTSGARFDADSGRPLAAMVAAALGVPVTMLLGDPGVTGARATAQTLDQPTELEMRGEQSLWRDVHRDVCNHVIDEAVIAPRGPLTGTQAIEADRIVVVLANEDDRSIDVSFPDFDSVPIDVMMKAIQAADQMGKTPPLTIARLVLSVLEVDNADEILDELTDDEGNWIGPDTNVGQAAADAFNRGEDPAAVIPAGDEPPNADD